MRFSLVLQPLVTEISRYMSVSVYCSRQESVIFPVFVCYMRHGVRWENRNAFDLVLWQINVVSRQKCNLCRLQNAKLSVWETFLYLAFHFFELYYFGKLILTPLLIIWSHQRYLSNTTYIYLREMYQIDKQIMQSVYFLYITLSHNLLISISVIYLFIFITTQYWKENT